MVSSIISIIPLWVGRWENLQLRHCDWKGVEVSNIKGFECIDIRYRVRFIRAYLLTVYLLEKLETQR
ncbi:hypothetical protein ACP6PL_23700 [Dapis sp. BLCC M126]|uniref:hypothetical protein n=1 Tax=Dapis sp. BLCC M126 TaxID=3400189 RepID=UPI003CF78B27